MIIAIYFLLGAIAGILAGLLGVGGGLVIVPALVLIFTYQGFAPTWLMHLAITTSLATILMTSIMSTYAHHRHGAVSWSDLRLLTPGIMLGAIIGAHIAGWLSSAVLKNIFAIFEILVAVQMGLSVKAQSAGELPRKTPLRVGGFVTGGVSTILGIGGGTITVPLLVWCGRSMHRAVATSAACGFPIALFGMLSYMLIGYGQQDLPQASIGYLYWPAFVVISVASMLFAPLGARWAHQLPVHQLKRLFALILLFIGVRMLLS